MVPRGGVRQGQVFGAERTLIRPSSIRSFTSSRSLLAVDTARSETTPLLIRGASSSSNTWKTPLCGVFRQGLGHVLGACCCPHLLAAQVYYHSRSGANVLIAMVPVVLFWIFTLWVGLSYYMFTGNAKDDDKDEMDHAILFRATYVAVSCWFVGYTWYILAKLRALVRHQYQIPPAELTCSCRWWWCCCCPPPSHDYHHNKYILDDCCVSLFCCCCVASQLALQTSTTEHTVARSSRCCSPCSSTWDDGNNNNNDDHDENSTVAETNSRSDSPSSLVFVV